MWNNRWGSLTGIRIPREGNATKQLGADLQSLLSAQEAGLIFSPLRKDAKSGVESPVDFGQLFVAFSFFVIAAALALTGMLFSFSMQQRNRQAGLLMALGYSTPKIRWLFLGEGACVSLVGVTLGLWGAWGYGKTVLGLLSGKWGGAVTGAQIGYSPEIKSLIFGGVGALFMSLMAMGWASRKQLRLEPTVLLGQGERAGKKGLRPRDVNGWIPPSLR